MSNLHQTILMRMSFATAEPTVYITAHVLVTVDLTLRMQPALSAPEEVREFRSTGPEAVSRYAQSPFSRGHAGCSGS